MTDLATALIAVQLDIPAIPHDSNGHGFTFTSLGAIINVMRPILARHGLAIIQMPATPSSPANIALQTIILHESGEQIAVIGELPLMDVNKRMNASQTGGAAFSYLRRYAYAAAFGIVADGDVDDVRPPAQEPEPAVIYDADERAIMADDPGTFIAGCLDLIPYYHHENHVKNTLRKMDVQGIPTDARKRVMIFKQLRHYAQVKESDNAKARSGGKQALDALDAARNGKGFYDGGAA